MDQNDAAGSAGAQDRPLGRGLEDVSHLFLSRKTGDASRGDRAGDRPSEGPSPPPEARGGVAVLRPAPVTRDRLAVVLKDVDGALEEGLRAIDTRIPCHPCGEIDVLAVDRTSQLTIIDFDTIVNDGLLLRGIGHFDWIVRNMPNVQRMYRAETIDVSLPPRLVLLAPQFSPVLRRVARQITRPQIHCVRYHWLDAPGGPGILFEPVAGE
jgi:hypothetical protein